MQIRYEQLAQTLKGPLAPLYVLSSNEHLLLLEAADSIRRAARAQLFNEREILSVERHFKWSSLLAANQSQSLFGDKKIIELRIPSGKPGKEGGAALQEFVKHLNDDTICLITLPKLDWTTQKSAWVTALQKAGVYVEIPVVERNQLPGWIAQRLAAQQQQTERAALDFIADRVEGNLLAAHQEIQKLGLLYPAGSLSLDQISAAVLNVARYDVFKLNEAMLSGDVPRLVRMLKGLEGEGEALPLVLWAMSEEIRTLLKLKIGMSEGRPLAALIKEMRIWGGREKWIEGAVRRLNLQKLQTALVEAAKVDKLVKGLRSPEFAGTHWDSLLQLALMIAR